MGEYRTLFGWLLLLLLFQINLGEISNGFLRGPCSEIASQDLYGC